jgi:nucleotide-binding universal stress UspA family protein
VAPAGGAPPPGLVVGSRERCAQALEMLSEMARTVSPTCGPCRTAAVEGPVGPELDRLAARRGAMLVAIGPRRHRPLAGALSASVAKHLLRRGSTPVLVCPSPEATLA